MKKHLNRILSVLLCALLFCSVLPVAIAADEVPEGYTAVSDAWDLYFMRDALNGKFILTADIDLTEYVAAGGDLDNNGHGWAPIGENGSIPFSGSFDGNGHTIKGLHIEDIQTNYAGLFGYLTGTVKNLILENVSIIGSCQYMGAVAGRCSGTISGIRVSGMIQSTRTDSMYEPHVGAIAGYLLNGTIDGCANTATLSASENQTAFIGGICGRVYSSGDNVTISCCYNTGAIAGRGYLGGIVGLASVNSNYPNSAYIEDCYNTAQINATDYNYNIASGICGILQKNSYVLRCINLGVVKGEDCVKKSSIAYQESSSVSFCYYLRGTADAGIYGKTDMETTTVSLSEVQSKLASVYGFLDFENTWFLNTETGLDYPQLRAVPQAGLPQDGEPQPQPDPIPVTNVEELYAMRYGRDKNYILMQDIDLTEEICLGGDWDNNGYGWAPIGENGSIPFSGTFDGNGHTIKGLRIEDIQTSCAGLFGYLTGTVKNFTLEDVSISGECRNMGAVTGYCYGGTISGVRVSGMINNTRTVSMDEPYVGAITGYLLNGTITGCANTATLSVLEHQTAYAGGICGRAFSSGYTVTVRCCFNTGAIAGRGYLGGIVGLASVNSNYPNSAYIEDCYNTAQITATDYDKSSGICGFLQSYSYVQRCINLGMVNGADSVKKSAIAFRDGGTVSSCYYLRGTADAGVYGQTDTATTVVSLSEALSKKQQAYGKLDFTNTWFFDASTGIEHPQLIVIPEITSHTHSYNAVVTEPTCTQRGFTTYTCACGDTYIDNYTDALGHDFSEWSETKAAKCTEAGEKTRSCSRCDAVETEAIAALGHAFGEWAVTKDAACAETGTETRTCSRCEEIDSRDIPAKGHNYNAVVTAPTCTEKGYTTYTCSVCKNSYTKDEVSALGHDFSAWNTTTAATCTDTGEKTRTCSRCDASETEVIDALGHTFSEWAVTTPATCIENGEESRSCSRCKTVETREISAPGHSYTVVVTDPTCTAGGYTTHTCSVCNDSFVTDEVAALGHTFGAWTYADADNHTRSCSRGDVTETEPHNYIVDTDRSFDATEEAEGQRVYVCPVCGNEKTVPLPKLDHVHNYGKTVVAPTCEAEGYTVYTCSACGDTFTTDRVNALGHAWDAGKVTKAAKCTEDGVKTFTCVHDSSHTYTEAIPATGHAFGSWTQTKAPTVYAEGAQTQTCANCGEKNTRSIPKLPMPKVVIQNFTASSKAYDYRSTITFKATVEKPLSGGQIHWFVDGKDVGTGDSYTAENVKQGFSLQAKYYADSKEIPEAATEVEKVNVNTGFFAKLKAFFRGLFGRLPKVVQEYLGVEILDRVHP